MSYTDAKEIAKRNELKTITCEIVTCFDDDEIANDICQLISFAMGCKVNWLYKIENDNKQILNNRIVKDYSSFNVIPMDVPNEIIRFLETSLEKYIKIKRKNNLQNVINIINDGKVDGDFLESRAIKICIAYEILKDAYLKESERLLILEKNEFKKLKKAIRSTMNEYCRKNSINDNEIILLKDNIVSINHFPFRIALSSIIDEANPEIDQNDIQRVSLIRNKLVHAGEFISQNDTFNDYCFLFTKITEIILGLLSYQRKYLDWTKLDTINGSFENSMLTDIKYKKEF